MKNILLLLAICAAFTSCKKSTENPIIYPDPVYVPDTIVTVSKIQNVTNQPDPKGNGVYSMLGFGYDITGKYEHISAVRGQAIDVLGLAKDNDNNFNIGYGSSMEPFVVFGSNAEHFVGQFRSPGGEGKNSYLFKGTITASFPDKDSFSRKYIYGNYSLISRIYYAIMRYNEGYLTPEFTQDILAMSSADLVGKYGTHVLTGIEVGQKLNIIYQAVAKDKDGERTTAVVSSNFTVALKNVFGLFSGQLDKPNARDLAAVSSQKIVYDAVGGDTSTLKADPRFKTTKINITEWLRSNTKENAAFIGIRQNGLVSLDQLITDPVKKAEVKTCISKYIADQQVKLID